MVMKEEKSFEDIEAGPHLASQAAGESESSLYFSDADDGSWQSPYNSYCDDFRCSRASSDEIDGFDDEPCRSSCISSECSFEVDLEGGSPDTVVNLERNEKDCRICHLGLESNAAESGVAIVLGCSCKDDLAAAHKQCAETWFKIRGNKTCEICGSAAKNVPGACETESVVEHSNETTISIDSPSQPTETRHFWQGRRLLNFLLACIIFAFVISWLFHFNVPG
ncbi:uncharacterized protein LOC109829808 [Asparagus officinalis]|uniref:uncharacterized protein LOC109829808 n=1 Tax=Asparagus officinalis TaxID=4686 RepID=UPI00098E3528|nr:uncharacterized protein LOC109829808 [Asparagus officinalis]